MNHDVTIESHEGTGYDTEIVVACSCGAALLTRSMETDGPVSLDAIRAASDLHLKTVAA